MNKALLVVLVALTLARCTCEPEPDPQPLSPVGTLRAVVVQNGGVDGVELRLDSTDARVRVLSVDVRLTGAQASVLRAVGRTDIAEGALDAPRADVTVVLADTRRIPLPDGVVAVLETDAAPTAVSLSAARAVDDQGRERTVTVVVP